MRPTDIDELGALGRWFHNLHLPDGTQTAPDHVLGDFPGFKWRRVSSAVPLDLQGWSVLDIGCNGGFYSFEMARRGAQVVGVDVEPMYVRQARWAARQFEMEARVDFVESDVYRLMNDPRQYDLVWFTGVFYHLRYPLLALDLVRRATRQMMVFQSMTIPCAGDDGAGAVPPDLPLSRREELQRQSWPRMAFIEHRVAGDESNWWVPNSAGVEALLRSAGFEVLSHPEHEFYICRPTEVPEASRRDLLRVKSAFDASLK